MSFVWFWTFWHWSKESFREGAMLRSPLLGIGGHWDEWFHHQASAGEREAIDEAGRTESGQRRFMTWLRRHWAREAGWRDNRLVPDFVLRQLSTLPPFDAWQALETHRDGYGVAGVKALVLAEGSAGEAEDVCTVEAVTLPGDADRAAPAVVAEGFRADDSELTRARSAALSLLCGSGLLVHLALWLASGRRPYPFWLKASLAAGWLAVGGTMLYLVIGPDPGAGLLPICIALVVVGSALTAASLLLAGRHCYRAWRQGRRLAARLRGGQLRLHMNLGLTLQGGSAGLAFCLSTLASLCRAHPRTFLPFEHSVRGAGGGRRPGRGGLRRQRRGAGEAAGHEAAGAGGSPHRDPRAGHRAAGRPAVQVVLGQR